MKRRKPNTDQWRAIQRIERERAERIYGRAEATLAKARAFLAERRR